MIAAVKNSGQTEPVPVSPTGADSQRSLISIEQMRMWAHRDVGDEENSEGQRAAEMWLGMSEFCLEQGSWIRCDDKT